MAHPALRNRTSSAALAAAAMFLSIDAGCGSPTSGPSEQLPPSISFSSGRRLVPWALTAPGTEPVLIGVFDRQIGAPCRFKNAADGKLRCLPDAIGAAPPEMFVEGTAAQLERPGRITHTEIKSSDSGRFRMSDGDGTRFVDRKWPAPCSIERKAGEMEGRCVPRAAYATASFPGLYEDGSCDKLLAGDTYFKPPSPPVIVLKDLQPYVRGPAHMGTVFAKQPGLCVPWTNPNPNLTLYSIGAALPADTLTSLKIVPRGTERLKLKMVEDETGALTADVIWGVPQWPLYFDTPRNMECAPARIPDGSIRCIGATEFYNPTDSFSDSACQRPVVLGGGSQPGMAALVKPEASAAVVSVTKVHRLGAELTDVYQLKDGKCQAMFQKKITYRSLEDVISWDEFAPLAEWHGDERVK